MIPFETVTVFAPAVNDPDAPVVATEIDPEPPVMAMFAPAVKLAATHLDDDES